MRAKGRDIVELFGFSPDDVSPIALKTWEEKSCPFTGGRCSKTNHDQSLIYGTCSVTNGISKSEGAEIIICPKRFYANTHTIFNDVIKQVWPDQSKNLVVGGSLADLKKKALTTENPVVAFGQNSGKELQIRSNGTLSMDWVLQSYKIENGNLIPVDFVGIEIQSIDITGNYRDNWGAYKMIKEGVPVESIPNSGHGLNWANVHKRLIPQIIRKGNIYEKTNRCVGFFFILPEPVYQKFEEVIGEIDILDRPSKENLSVITLKLGENVDAGHIRNVEIVREVHYSLGDVAAAFIGNSSKEAPSQFEESLRGIFD